MEDDNALAAACLAFLRAKGWEHTTDSEVDAHARRFGWEDWPRESVAAK
jgi:hypothetical protein